MRFLLLITLLPLLASSQIFHFEDSTTTLIKNVNQSPAHWYIEIYNDVHIDTTLRWKAEFENVPTEWQINFDTQNTYHPNLLHNDSADFRLPITNNYPQKLIIGAALNGKTASASIHFYIYDPYNPIYSRKISYHFIVTQDAGLEETTYPNEYTVLPNKILINDVPEGAQISLFSLEGKLIYQNQVSKGDVIDLPSGLDVFILKIYSPERMFSATHKLKSK
jgi:hypothetical protein